MARFRKRGVYDTGRDYRISGRGQQLNGRGCGIVCGGRYGRGIGRRIQGGRGVVNGVYENGIYMSDVTRYSEYEEWSAL